MKKRFNVRYFDEEGNAILYLGSHVPTRYKAEEWAEKFNQRYRKPYPNGRGYYAAAQVVEV